MVSRAWKDRKGNLGLYRPLLCSSVSTLYTKHGGIEYGRTSSGIRNISREWNTITVSLPICSTMSSTRLIVSYHQQQTSSENAFSERRWCISLHTFQPGLIIRPRIRKDHAVSACNKWSQYITHLNGWNELCGFCSQNYIILEQTIRHKLYVWRCLNLLLQVPLNGVDCTV